MESKREIRRAATLLGRRGGRKSSEQKAQAARETGRTVGGRKAVESFELEKDGIQDGSVVILGFRSTGERELRQKDRWYRSRSGRPLFSRADSPALTSGTGFPSVDVFERLSPSHDTVNGRVVRMTCPACGKQQFFLFLGLEPGYSEEQAQCRSCSKG